jgi:Leucine-rich repeat (LRR) protein
LNRLRFLPPLPTHLELLFCDNNRLLELPSLSSNSLTTMSVSYNSLRSLPPLPPTLEMLVCTSNFLQELPVLNNILSVLICSDNQIQHIGELPETIREIDVSNNPLIERPRFPPNAPRIRY